MLKCPKSDRVSVAFRCVSVVCNILKTLCVPVLAFRCVSVRVGCSEIIEIIGILSRVPVRFGSPHVSTPPKGGDRYSPLDAQARGAKSLCDAPRFALGSAG